MTLWRFVGRSLARSPPPLLQVLNAVLVPAFNQKERERLALGRHVVLKGTAIVFAGAALLVVASEKKNTAFGVKQVEEAFSSIPFLAFEAAALLGVFGTFIYARRQPARYQGDKAGILLFFSYSAGWAGAQLGLLAKAMLEIFKNQWTDVQNGGLTLGPTFFIMAGVSVLLVTLEIYLIDHGLKTFDDGVKFVSVFQAYLVLLGAGGGCLFFKEYRDFVPWQIALFAVGMVFCVWGVLVVSLAEGIKGSIDARVRTAKRKARASGKVGKGEIRPEGLYVDACCGISDVLCDCYYDPEDVDPTGDQAGDRAALLHKGMIR